MKSVDYVVTSALRPPSEIIVMNKNSGAQSTSTGPITLNDLLADRYTCRAFHDAQVPRTTIEQILGIARLTPSWCNTQPWHLTITEGEATRRFAETLHAHAAKPDVQAQPDFTFPSRYAGPYDERRRKVGKQLYDSIGIAHGDRDVSQRFIGRADDPLIRGGVKAAVGPSAQA